MQRQWRLFRRADVLEELLASLQATLRGRSIIPRPLPLPASALLLLFSTLHGDFAASTIILNSLEIEFPARRHRMGNELSRLLGTPSNTSRGKLGRASGCTRLIELAIHRRSDRLLGIVNGPISRCRILGRRGNGREPSRSMASPNE